MELKRRLEKLDQFFELDYSTPLPIVNHYSTPETLGKDRLAAVCGAHYLFPEEDVLVIDAGTCITMDSVIVMVFIMVVAFTRESLCDIKR